MISQSEWESMEETMYLLSSPTNAEQLLDGIRELDAGGARSINSSRLDTRLARTPGAIM